MPVDLVVDASVVAKFYFDEEGSDRARSLLTSGEVLAAPDLLWLELASVAAKKVRLGLMEVSAALDAVGSLGDIVDEVFPARDLARLACRFSCDDGGSVYDAAYLALARHLNVPVVTADTRLADRAVAAGVGGLVRRL
jgi:predicted nucleic acid-binding protein